MVQYCVPKCKNRSDLFVFSISKNDNNRKLWIKILDLPAQIPNVARICSNHFLQEAFDETNLFRKRLKPNALSNANINNIVLLIRQNYILHLCMHYFSKAQTFRDIGHLF
ncbi:hypothetical protein PUN28_004300 [Cardiocondyla obscurior]|uniref:THAP-type domain-containing protein n=1 Tax=Cardiocondyla obscurior TaxID=286306 RepID=A0AAW2GBY1_9HYME